MEKSSDQIVRPLTVKYAIALGLLAALAAANYFMLRSEIRDGEGMARIVNDAGRQRMLLHRTTILAERIVFSFDAARRSQLRSELMREVQMLEETHHELMSSERPRQLNVADDVRMIYEDSPWLLDSEMRNYLLHLRSLADSKPDELNESNPHFAYIRNPETIDKIRKGLEAVVDVYERMAVAKSRHVHLLAIWSFASTIVLLLLDGWFVFLPMARQVKKDIVELNNLNETLEQRVDERTAEAEQRAAQLAESEAALRASEALYTSLVHHLPMSVLRKDREGHFTFANDEFCRLLNKPLAEIIGMTDADVYSAELATKYRLDDLQVMQSGAVFQSVEEHRDAEGRELFVEVLKVPLRDADGEIIGTQTMFWDVTDQKETEQRAMQAERLAAIGQMVAGVAHESRNALQQIQACSQLLKWELDGDDKSQELLADLQRAEARLLRTFDELRGYAAPRKLDRKPCDVRDVVAAAWSATQLQRDGRNVTFSESGNGAATTCDGDPFQLEQVFRNLFENAVAAAEDPARIEVVYEQVAQPSPPALQITVADNGPGLSAEQRERIFEPFFTTKTQGTGLGMAIVKRIIDAHGGQIHAESNGTKGAAIVITLPLSHVESPRTAGNWSPSNQ